MSSDASTELLCEAARNGDLAVVSQLLAAGADVHAVNGSGFTALESAAMGTSTRDNGSILAVLCALIGAGSPFEHRSTDGRTALYLAAEFSWTVAPIALLIGAGANADVRNAHGVQVVVNAMTDEVKRLLAERTGEPLPPPQIAAPAVKRPSVAEWQQAERRINALLIAFWGAPEGADPDMVRVVRASRKR